MEISRIEVATNLEKVLIQPLLNLTLVIQTNDSFSAERQFAASLFVTDCCIICGEKKPASSLLLMVLSKSQASSSKHACIMQFVWNDELRAIVMYECGTFQTKVETNSKTMQNEWI